MPCLKHLKDIPWVWVLKSISATKYAPKGLLWTAVTQNYRLLSSNLPVLPFENQLAQNNSVLETKEGLEGIWMWSPSMTVPACSKASAGNSRDLGSMTQEFHPCSLYGMMEQLQACPFASASFTLMINPSFVLQFSLKWLTQLLCPLCHHSHKCCKHIPSIEWCCHCQVVTIEVGKISDSWGRIWHLWRLETQGHWDGQLSRGADVKN